MIAPLILMVAEGTEAASGPGGNGGFLLEDSSGYILLESGSFLLQE